MTGHFISVQEKKVAGFGYVALLQSHESSTIFRFVFKLDIFQSNNQRDWLALRWKEPCLRQSVLLLKAAKELQIIYTSQESCRQRAVESIEAWVKGIVEAHERLKLSRV